MRVTLLTATLPALAVVIGACTGGTLPTSTASAPIPTATPTFTANATPVSAGSDSTSTSSFTPTSTPLPTPPESEEAPGRKNPSIQPSSTKVQGISTIIEYGQVPEGFVPELPDLETLETSLLSIVMEQSTIGALTRVSFQRFLAGGYGPDSFSFSFEGEARSIIEEDYIALAAERVWVMKCGYRLSTPGIISVQSFWFGSTPSVADPDRLRDRLPEHPVLRNIKGARSQCPATKSEAETVLGSAFRRLNGNWYPSTPERQPGYIELKFLRTTEDGFEDVYRFFDYNTSRGVPVKMAEGTLTVNADGDGYMKAANAGAPCPIFGGEITVSSAEEMQLDATLNCLSPTGEIIGRDINIRWQR